MPAGLSTLTAIAAGESYTVALKSDGTVAAWGNDNYGQTDAPAGLSNVTAIAAGEYHTVALKIDGTVAAWGNDAYGQCLIPALLERRDGHCGGSMAHIGLEERRYRGRRGESNSLWANERSSRLK